MPSRPIGLDLPSRAVTRILQLHYGLTAQSVRRFDSELSTVCRVETTRGALMVKAVHFSTENHAVSRWRSEAAEHMADEGLPMARGIPNLDGELLSIVDTEQGAVSAQVSNWLEGAALESVTATPNLLHDVGRTAALVSRSLSAWPPPPFPVTHPWELTRSLSVLKDVITAIDDAATRELIAESTRRFSDYAGLLGTVPRSTVHHDLHDANLLVDPVRGRVCGVLDMGDMVPAPRVAELVVAAAYACRGATDPADAFVRVAEGWGRTLPLTDDEVVVLFPSALARLAVNVGIWVAREDSDRGDYARSRSASSRRALEMLLSADDAALESALYERLSA